MKTGMSKRFVNLKMLVAVMAVVLGCQFSLPFSQASDKPLRVGFMGDSTLDEYRGTDNRGNSVGNARTTLNWMEQLVVSGKIDAGEWGEWDEPRRTGYAYNWARSASTIPTMVRKGQDIGLAEQVADGMIDLVIISVGNHDFAPYNQGSYYNSIYEGTLSGEKLTSTINFLIEQYTKAVDTILAAGSVPMIVTTVADANLSPLNFDHPDADKRQAVSEAINRVNEGIRTLAEEHDLAVFDYEAFAVELFSRIQDGVLDIGGVGIRVFEMADEPHNGILGDHIHPGTVLSGLIANGYLKLINELVEPDIPLFSEEEIVVTAGLDASSG